MHGRLGYSGDGAAATNASLFLPAGLALDTFGNLYIADTSDQRIRKVGTNGVITTVAGNGTNGFSGDGNQAANASLNRPSGVAFDASGNLYVADEGNHRIRKVWLYAEYPSLTLNSLSAANAGSYSVVLTSPYGSVTSSIVALQVAPIIITAQPRNTSVFLGSNAVFSVTASGTGWLKAICRRPIGSTSATPSPPPTLRHPFSIPLQPTLHAFIVCS